jgi:hypothetical protein
MRFLLAFFAMMAVSSTASAQIEDEFLGTSVDEYSLQPLDEALIEDDAAGTFILDNTKTKIGRDLYEEFYRQWNSIQLDSVSLAQFKASVKTNSELIIDLEEIPAPGLSNIVSIKVGDLLVWQQFVQTRSEALIIQVNEAVQEVLGYFVSYQDIQNQLGSEDQSGTGIY